MRTGTAVSQTLHRDLDGQPEFQPLPLCEQCQMSRFALLLFQIMSIHGKVDGAVESMYLEISCWKHTATFVMDRLSISTGSWASRLITGDFTLVALLWYSAKCLTQKTGTYVRVSVRARVSFVKAALVPFSWIFQSSLSVSEEEQSWASRAGQ